MIINSKHTNYMKPAKILTELNFAEMLAEANAQTQTGSELIDRYRTKMMQVECTCAIVNQFVREASQHRYDNAVNAILEALSDYITSNKTSWALATACENIHRTTNSYNYLNLNACKQVEPLLEMAEDDVVKYIRSGALKSVMYCESFRSIAKQVFANQTLVEANVEYKKETPISLIENVGDGLCFMVEGTIYKMDNNKNIQVCAENEVSNTFRNVMSLLESALVEKEQGRVVVNYNGVAYEITEANKVKKGEKEFTVESFRDHARLMVTASHPRHARTLAGVLESIALVAENFDQIAVVDNAAVYSTTRDRFVVIEGNGNIYATSIRSTRNPKWTINENAVDALSFIKSKTNTEISENYREAVQTAMENISEEERVKMEKEMNENEVNSLKEKIASLTEKYKNDPVKLALLADLAEKLTDIQEG